MDTKYELYIYGGTGGTTTRITSSKRDNGNYYIKKLEYSKGLYSPNTVNVEIKVSKPLATDAIKTTFASKSADLTVYAKESNLIKTLEICKDYIVYQSRIVSEASGQIVYLTLFSRDKLLTLDKFSMVYLNQRLWLNIIGDSLLKDGGILANCKVGVLSDTKTKLPDIKRLQFLYYEVKSGMFAEAIQPYRVQYNEDFYRFISRVACQCGEMLYFEDGKLTLGPDPKGSTKTIKDTGNDTDIYRIEYPAVETSQLTVNDYHRNFLKETDDVLGNNNGLQYSDCESFDEYYDTFNKDTLPDSKGKEFYWPDIANLVIKSAAPAFGVAFASKDYVTAIEKGLKVAKDLGSILGGYATNSTKVNEQYIENVFDKARSKTNNFSAEQQMDSSKNLCQFADVYPKGQLMHDVLANIRKMELTAAKQKITIQIKTPSFARLKLKLGNRVQLGNDTKTTYVVTACRGDFALIKYLPDGKTVDSLEKDITEIDLVPLQGELVVPPYNECAEFTPVQPQTAIVSDASDPRLVGRVRVRYPWQAETTGSPWVRILTPFSSASGCIHFKPKVGDEVILGYVGGNIERPYVIGSLFGKNEKNIHDSLFTANNNVIRVGSQRLVFREGSMSGFLASFVPVWGFVSQFVPDVSLNMKTEHSSGWHGTTRLTDEYGFWKIEGNTASRSVTIDSAWGKVSINAYTGINIEAVGDVTIKGNNINIKAQNNVTIESGIALKNARKSKNYTVGEAALKIAADVLSDFVNLDLSFIRTVWESIVPPKEGTLKIKSNRYLMLEAGKDGCAYDNTIQNGKTHRQFAAKDTSIVGKALRDLGRIYNAVDYYATNLIEMNRQLLTAETELNDVIGGMVGDRNIRPFAANDLQTAADIKNALKTGKVKDLQDYNNIKGLIGHDDGFQYGEGSSPARWIAAVKTLKARLNALDKAVTNKALKKELANVNDVIITQFSEKIRNQNDNYVLSSDDKNEIYRAACTEYIRGKFTLGNQADWNTRVDGLAFAANVDQNQEKSLAKTFAKDLFRKTVDSLMTSSDYELKAYTDSQAQNLSDGKIIMSYNKDMSLEVDQGNIQDGSGTLVKVSNVMSLDVVKNAMKRTFPAQQQPDNVPNQGQ